MFSTEKGHVTTTKQERLIVLGHLSSVLAHEIRNPLAGISAATQMLGGKLQPTDPGKKYVSMILKEVDRVNDIVKDLVDFSRESRAYMMRASVATLVDAALEKFSGPFEQAGIRVEKQSDDVPFVVCDAEHMGRAFGHLIANAVDAMPDGGTLTVRTAYDEGAKHVSVIIEDTGRGVEIENLAELFSPFYTTKTKGSGLGLPIALKFVEEHGGTIAARRGEPSGLTMTVRWPVEPPADAGGDDSQGTEQISDSIR